MITPFIINCLRVYYCIEAVALTLLPIGADVNASVYKIQATDHKTYFVKVKQSPFSDVSSAILELLQRAGIEQLIAPVKTVKGEQIYREGDLTLIVYPFVRGRDGFSCPLMDEQWIALGRALRQVHEVRVPDALEARMRRENFSPKWREAVRHLYTLEAAPEGDEVAGKLWKFLQEKRAVIEQIVNRAEQLGQMARGRPLKFVLCHSDIHGGNVLVDEKEAIYIVDWDEPVLAPKERDLMFIGGGVGNVWNQPREEKLFYQGYGSSEIDGVLLSYYRYERIVEDIAVYCQELLPAAEGKDQMYRQFRDMFVPGGVVDIAFATDPHTSKRVP
jgi:spectinomycin phosphotransferase